MPNYDSTSQQVYSRMTHIAFAKEPNENVVISWQQCTCIQPLDGIAYVVDGSKKYGQSELDISDPKPFQVYNPPTGEPIIGKTATFQEALAIIYSIWLNQQPDMIPAKEEPVTENRQDDIAPEIID